MRMMWRRAFSLGCVLGLLVLISGAPGVWAGEVKYFWKIATLAPKDIGPSKMAQELIYPQLEKACDGAVKMKVYWGGVMGDDENLIQKMRIGQLQGAALSSEGTILACPEFAVVELPFLFNNYKEVDYIRTKMYPTFKRYFEKYGFMLGSWIDQDFDQIYSMKFPIASLADFAKARFGTAHGAMEELTLRTLGADTIALQIPEAPTAIRQGVVNAGVGPSFYLVGTQLYTSAKYITPINIRYSPATTIVAMDAWKQLPDQCKKNIELQYDMGTKILCAMMRESNQKYGNALVQYGLKRVTVTPENYEQIKKTALTVYKKLAGQIFPKALLDEVLGHLKTFRARADAPKIPVVPQPDVDLRLEPHETMAALVEQAKKMEAEYIEAHKNVKATAAPAKKTK